MRPATRNKLWTCLIIGVVAVVGYLWNNRINTLEVDDTIRGVHWQDVASAEGRFNISMPSPPKSSQQPIQSPTGLATMYTSTSATPHFQCSVSYLDIPSDVRLVKSVDEIFAAGHATYAEPAVGKRQLSERVISFGAYPGREWRTEQAETDHRIENVKREYLVGVRIYILDFFATPDAAAFRKEEATFFDSFQAKDY